MLLISAKSKLEDGVLAYCFSLNPVKEGEVIWMKEDISYKKLFKKDFLTFIKLFSKEEIEHILQISFIEDGIVYVPKDDRFFFVHSEQPNCELNKMGLAITKKKLIPQEPITLDFNLSFDKCNFHNFKTYWVESKEEIIEQIKKHIGLKFNKNQNIRRAV
jgi:hypothetical protein